MSGRPEDELITVEEFCRQYRITRSTFYQWNAKGRAPRSKKLPNGHRVIQRQDLTTWWDNL